MNKENIVEFTALLELKSKYDLKNIDIEFNNLHKVLLSMYHMGYELIASNIKEEYKEALNTFNPEQWDYYIEDLDAVLTQLTKNNYRVLLNDIKSV
jgi:hypothetical protein